MEASLTKGVKLMELLFWEPCVFGSERFPPPGLAGGFSSAVQGDQHSAMALGTQMGQMAWRSPKAGDSRG